MAVINEQKERRVIPNWRPFATTVWLGELDSVSINPIVIPNVPIDDYISDFKENRTIPFAADLVSASIVNGLTNDTVVRDAAQFLVSSKISVTKSQYDIAKIIITPQDDTTKNQIDRITADELEQDLPEKQNYYPKINKLKQYLIDFPYNPIAWVELSRCYSVIGHKSQAIRAMEIAIQLAPDNRFVMRCAVRLFSHYYELDIAHDILRKNNITNYDPWLMSAEISIASRRDRNSRFLKKGVDLIESNQFSPFSITELASSIATVELLSGDRKKSRKMFAKSLLSPNDNSLAQIEWVLTAKDKSLIDREQINTRINYDFEAQAISNFYEKKFQFALNDACRWFCDTPFSKRPVILGSTIAGILDKKTLAIDFLSLGLISHSNDAQLLNNIAYYLALENRTQESWVKLEKAKLHGINKSKAIDICLIATDGLICFRNKKYDEGRDKYLTAIAETVRIDDPVLNKIAILNYAREELLAKTDEIDSVMQIVSTISDKDDDVSIEKLYSEVMQLYDVYKQTK